MVFSSLLFLFYFLAPLIIIYTLVPKRYKNILLVISSLLFYAWGEPKYIILMIFSACFNFFMGFLIDQKKSKLPLIFSCVINIGLLVVFKYTDFIISSFNTITTAKIPLLNLALPIGISFYTFQAMSYCIDVYRGSAKVQKNLLSFTLYLSFFPQLIAGPIVRYNDIDSQLNNHDQKITMMSDGIIRFIVGLGKKVLIANNLGILWELSKEQAEISLLCAWLGIIAYTLQIYYDFSAYSDMAIGLGKFFGFKFCENFNYPYISKSITEFWRRWHMSLSTWFKEYVYIPLGGSRVSSEKYKKTTKIGNIILDPEKKAMLRRYFNIFIVWMLTGLWHGASFNFVFWGIYYGVLLIIEKKYLLKRLSNLNPVLSHLYTMVIVMVGWVFFAEDSLKDAFIYLIDMINIFDFGFSDHIFLYRILSYGITLVIAIIGAIPYTRNLFLKITGKKLYFLRIIFSILVLFVSLSYLVDNTYNPFLYFRF